MSTFCGQRVVSGFETLRQSLLQEVAKNILCNHPSDSIRPSMTSSTSTSTVVEVVAVVVVGRGLVLARALAS